METDSEGKKRRANGHDVIKQVLNDIDVPLLYIRANEAHAAQALAKKITFLLTENKEAESAPKSESETETEIETKTEEPSSTTTTTLTRAVGPVANIWTATKEKYRKRKSA